MNTPEPSCSIGAARIAISPHTTEASTKQARPADVPTECPAGDASSAPVADDDEAPLAGDPAPEAAPAGEVAAQLGRRERTKAAILAIGGELRRIHLELGRRLAHVGVLPDPGWVDLLVTRELRSAFATHTVPGTIDLTSRREWVLRHTSAAALPSANCTA